jgi:hypothetical protein
MVVPLTMGLVMIVAMVVILHEPCLAEFCRLGNRRNGTDRAPRTGGLLPATRATSRSLQRSAAMD